MSVVKGEHGVMEHIHLDQEIFISSRRTSDSSDESVANRSSKVISVRKPVARIGLIHQKKLRLKIPLVASGEKLL
jgi:hypothetical protein